jgi:hydroxyacylglutathione hydrolase
MILKHVYEATIAQSAYLVGCAETGEALLIDPNIDIGPYIDAAEAEGLRITGVADTHIHADYVSGALALAEATGATLYVSGEGGPDWQYAFAGAPFVRVLHDGDAIELGRIRLDVVHTPGHTPEHLMFVVTDTRAADAPLGAFTGDFLFVGDVGRPDLLDAAAGQTGTKEPGARRLFASLGRLAALPDHLVIWPGHGSGSACGKSLGGVPVSSLGYERMTNWALRADAEEGFVSSVLADQPDPPMYFAEMKRVNRTGTAAWSAEPPLTAVVASRVEALVASRELIVDVRSDATRALLPGALAIPLGRSFLSWAGALVPSGEPFFIVAEDARAAEAARRALALIGRRDAAGWIAPAVVDEYVAAGGRLDALETIDAPRKGQTIVDVRTTAEWQLGHLDGAVHVPLARLPERLDALDRLRPLLVYCQAGVRSAVAATALRRLGFARVSSLEGGLAAYARRDDRTATLA